MIGVIADPAEHDVAREFFELFKTPWEFCREDRQYDVLLCAGEGRFDRTAKLVLVYAGREMQFDDKRKIPTGRKERRGSVLAYQGNRIPIYGDHTTFYGKENRILIEEDSRECAAYLEESNGKVLARIGYDLFSEVRSLLTVGQPSANASIPTLELHISFLRDLITGSRIRLVEIPPVPAGSQFVACLTHDVDHPSIRQHKWDHTMFGLLYRAVFDSWRRLFRGQMPVQDLVRNWAAALKLPFVHLGLAKDFWREFPDRYLELEQGLRSTFFVIPFKDQPGRNSDGPAPTRRAARYGALEIADTVRKLMTAGCEVGLHGIDVWLDSSRGHEEIEEIRRLTGATNIGVRMHWLYYNQQAASSVEASGAAYDSTIGYNETVGYRAGTTQVYKPVGASELLELPLHVMDTALFYPSYLDLTPHRAKVLVGRMIDSAVRFGGTLTINWHDRSLAPERLWGGCYRDLIQEMKNQDAWFSTAGQAVSWFRKRRSAAFVADSIEPGAVRAKVAVDQGDPLPGLRLRIHKSRKPSEIGYRSADDYVDTVVEETAHAGVTSEARG